MSQVKVDSWIRHERTDTGEMSHSGRPSANGAEAAFVVAGHLVLFQVGLKQGCVEVDGDSFR